MNRERSTTRLFTCLMGCLQTLGCEAAFSEEDIALFDSLGELSGVVEVPKNVRLPERLRVGLVWHHESPGSKYPTFTAGASAAANIETEEENPRFSLLVGPAWRRQTLPAKGTLVLFVDLDDDGELALRDVRCGDRLVGVAHNVIVRVPDKQELEVKVGTKPCFPDLDCAGTNLKPGGGRFGRPTYEGISVSLDSDLLLGMCPTTEPLATYGHCFAARWALRRSIEDGCPQGDPGCLVGNSPTGVFKLTQLQTFESMRTHGCCGFALGDSPWFCSPSVGCPEGYYCCKDTCKRTCTASQRRDVHWSYIPPGEFVMGSDPEEIDRLTNEEQHIVRLTRGFLIASTEVTETDFLHVVGYMPYTRKPDPQQPIRCTWHEAAAFCNRLSVVDALQQCYDCAGEGDDLRCTERKPFHGQGIYGCQGYRLPTEAEWEYAYRAGTTTSYYNGEMTDSKVDPKADEIAWYAGNVKSSDILSMPVALKLPNAHGLYDMSGNVEEWVQDCMAPYTNPGEVGVVRTNPAANCTDELTNSVSAPRVLRGGSVGSDAHMVRASTRVSGKITATISANGGLRCVRSFAVP